LLDPHAGPRAGVTAEGKPDSRPVILLWGKPAAKTGAEVGGQPVVTYRLDASNDRGTVLGTEPGIVVAAHGSEWAWTTTTVKAPAIPCEKRTGGDHEAPAVESTVTRGKFMLKGGSEHQMVVEAELPAAANEVREDVTLTGSVGPYVFAHLTSYRYSCGPLRITVAGFLAWDLEHEEAIEVLDEVTKTEALRAQGQRQLNEDERDDDPEVRSDSPDLVEVRPGFDANGKLGLTALLARVGTSGGDGTWSTGMRSVQLSTPLSARLTPYAEAPRAVRAFLRTHPGFTLQGWSRR